MIEHVVVLMLENRSFDHMLGFSGIRGVDATSGAASAVDGLTGSESNPLPGGAPVPIERGAPYSMAADPSHEFVDAVEHLCGPGTGYTGRGAYPPITNSGFASRFAATFPAVMARDGHLPMKAFLPEQLPVLTQLAREFCVCDRWFSSLPGPTWPNRFFIHAASSAGLDDSPAPLRTATAVVDGYRFANGTVFDRIEQAGLKWHIVEGDALPQAIGIHGMIEKALEGRFITLDQFKSWLAAGTLDASYVFIEPHYGHVLADGRNFRGGTSQHPLDDVTGGDRLIKEVYESLRASRYWESSLLIITYDEHGGFFDHVAPPAAAAPGDQWLDPSNNRNGFGFDQLGVRVPGVVVSPLIPRGLIDHSVRDHSSVSATLRDVFGTGPLTERDRAASGLGHLASLPAPRQTPAVLASPAVSGVVGDAEPLVERLAGDLLHLPAELSRAPEAALIGFVQLAIVREVHMAARQIGSVEKAMARLGGELDGKLAQIRHKLDAARLMRDVETRYAAFRATGEGPRS